MRAAMRNFDQDAAAEAENVALLCHRCGAILTPSAGTFYIVRIEAFADPSPRVLAEGMTRRELADEIDELIRQIGDQPEQTLMDQVYRRLTILLCWPCYRVWIENPAGP